MPPPESGRRRILRELRLPSFNYTTAPKGRIHDIPSWDHQESHSALSASELYEKFLRDRPKKPMKQVKPENVVSNMDEAFAI
jgi:hypothetical protein